MTLIKFSTKNLKNYFAEKDEKGVYVKLHYSDLENPIILREDINTKKIFFRDFHQVGKLGWVTFYELDEVFHLTDLEKKNLFKNKPIDDKIKTNEKNKEEYQVEFQVDDDFDDMFKNF